MTKNIVKEMIIFLLLALAIILILGVLLYKYVPANKIIPEKVSYTTPENVKTELLGTLTHTLCSLENKPSINFYALLKLYARDG